MRNRLHVIVSAVAVVAWCVFIFAMSAQPADESTELSMGIVWRIVGFIVPGYDQMSPADQLYWQEVLEPIARKTAHFLEYAVLGALMMNLVVRLSDARHGQVAREAEREDAREGVCEAEREGAREGRREGQYEHVRDAERESLCEDGKSPIVQEKARYLREHAVVAWALATIYASTDEIHQTFVPGRAGMPIDVLLDSAGVLVGVLVAFAFFSRARRR